MMKPLDRRYEQDQSRLADQAKVLKGVLKIGGQDGTISRTPLETLAKNRNAETPCVSAMRPEILIGWAT